MHSHAGAWERGARGRVGTRRQGESGNEAPGGKWERGATFTVSDRGNEMQLFQLKPLNYRVFRALWP